MPDKSSRFLRGFRTAQLRFYSSSSYRPKPSRNLPLPTYVPWTAFDAMCQSVYDDIRLIPKKMHCCSGQFMDEYCRSSFCRNFVWVKDFNAGTLGTTFGNQQQLSKVVHNALIDICALVCANRFDVDILGKAHAYPPSADNVKHIFSGRKNMRHWLELQHADTHESLGKLPVTIQVRRTIKSDIGQSCRKLATILNDHQNITHSSMFCYDADKKWFTDLVQELVQRAARRSGRAVIWLNNAVFCIFVERNGPDIGRVLVSDMYPCDARVSAYSAIATLMVDMVQSAIAVGAPPSSWPSRNLSENRTASAYDSCARDGPSRMVGGALSNFIRT